MPMIDGLIIRPLKVTDVSRVFVDWLRSYRREDELKHVPNPVYYHYHHELIASLMLDGHATWAVVVPSDKPDLIVGWACAEPLGEGPMLLHYVYVAKTYRRLGVGSRILATLGIAKDTALMVSHRTFPFENFLASRGNQSVYNPYIGMARLGAARPEGAHVTPAWREAVRKTRGKSKHGYAVNETAAERSAR